MTFWWGSGSRIRICSGSMTFWWGSGFGSGSWILILLFSSFTFKMPSKNQFKKKVFLLVTFWKHVDLVDPDSEHCFLGLAVELILYLNKDKIKVSKYLLPLICKTPQDEERRVVPNTNIYCMWGTEWGRNNSLKNCRWNSVLVDNF